MRLVENSLQLFNRWWNASEFEWDDSGVGVKLSGIIYMYNNKGMDR